MKFNSDEFKKLTLAHGKWGSWAIWDYSNEKSTEIIYKNIDDLNVRNILVGLNISKPVEIWGNFRGGRHDRKLKYAFNDSPMRGSYMTDLFKIKMKKSTKLENELKLNPELINENVERFITEMKDLNIDESTSFILLGPEDSILGKYYKTEFQKHFEKNPVIFHRHYSSWGTDKDWVESIWNKLNISANYQEVRAKYKVK